MKVISSELSNVWLKCQGSKWKPASSVLFVSILAISTQFFKIGFFCRELKLKKAIVDNFLPPSVKKDLNKRIRYDDASDTYYVEPPTLTKVKSIPVDRMELFPMFNKTRFQKLEPRKGIFFSNENLLLLQPDGPTWIGKNYVADKINPRTEVLIKEAVENIQKPLVINCDSKTSW